MAFKVHAIRHYNYSFDARSGGPGRIQLWGEMGKVAEIGFVADGATVPPPILYRDLMGADVFFQRSMFVPLLDMLRNENPVSITVNNQPPGFVFIHTGAEPVGEGE